MKNKNKKIEKKLKKYYSEINPSIYNGSRVPNLILRYQALYITK